MRVDNINKNFFSFDFVTYFVTFPNLTIILFLFYIV